MTDPKSFMDLEKWLNILKNQFQEILKYQVPIMCIGNKNDIYKGEVAFSTDPSQNVGPLKSEFYVGNLIFSTDPYLVQNLS